MCWAQSPVLVLPAAELGFVRRTYGNGIVEVDFLDRPGKVYQLDDVHDVPVRNLRVTIGNFHCVLSVDLFEGMPFISKRCICSEVHYLHHTQEEISMAAPIIFIAADGTKVPGHRRMNPDGTSGGWVADTASVATNAIVDYEAFVLPNAHVRSGQIVRNRDVVSENEVR